MKRRLYKNQIASISVEDEKRLALIYDKGDKRMFIQCL